MRCRVILCTAAVLAGLPPELLRPTLEALLGMYSALLVEAAELEADKAFEELAEAIASSGPTPSKCGR
jgi:hypothetical protein